jgi:hypothetical protein
MLWVFGPRVATRRAVPTRYHFILYLPCLKGFLKERYKSRHVNPLRLMAVIYDMSKSIWFVQHRVLMLSGKVSYQLGKALKAKLTE